MSGAKRPEARETRSAPAWAWEIIDALLAANPRVDVVRAFSAIRIDENGDNLKVLNNRGRGLALAMGRNARRLDRPETDVPDVSVAAIVTAVTAEFKANFRRGWELENEEISRRAAGCLEDWKYTGEEGGKR